MADAIFKDAVKLAMFGRMKPNDPVFFTRVIWATGRLDWLGPWPTRAKAHEAARTLRFRRIQSLFVVKVTKKADHG